MTGSASSPEMPAAEPQVTPETEARPAGDARHETGARPPLRVGLLVDSFLQPAWVHQMVEDLVRSRYAELAVVVLNEAGAASREVAPPRGLARLRRLLGNRRHLLYGLYSRLDEARFPPESDPFELVDIQEILDCAIVRVEPRMTRYSDYIEDEDLEGIRSYELDVAILRGFRILRGGALEIARYGVWSYHHGDNRMYRGGPPGFWEVYEGNPVTGAVLQILSEELDAGRVLSRAQARTDPLSVSRNRERIYWKAADFVPRKLRELHRSDPEEREPIESEPAFVPYDRRLYSKPTNREMLSLAARLAGRRVRNAGWEAFTRHQWFLAYKFARKASSAEDVPTSSLFGMREIIPPTDRFWADPFPVVSEDRIHIFVEEFLYETGLGHISVLELGRDGTVSEPVKVVDPGVHASYPYVFEWQGDRFMIPETADKRRIELYRATDFPYGWELESILLEDVAAADCTLVEIDDRWWMFASLANIIGRGRSDDLHLFHATSPHGPWTPHRSNPIKSDVIGSRPAGRLFSKGGSLYRPAQDCSTRYGHAICLYRIEQLDLDAFRETPAGRIDPVWAPRLIGTHTLNAAADLTIVDGLRRRRRFF